MDRSARVRRVDDRGILVWAGKERVVDVLFGGHRVWSFWTRRDTVRSTTGLTRLAAWPRSMAKYLDGHARVVVQDSATGEVLFDEHVTFGEGVDEIRFVDARGVELGIDKSGRMVPTFATRSSADVAALVDAVEVVLGALAEAGVRPFLAYGTLLGAVREGAVLGHDSDADVGYVSEFTCPVDVIRESFRLQRAITELGWRTSRYSGLAFKIEVPEEDGVIRGLDVFGGFMDGHRLYLMGEVGVDFDPAWLHPLTTCRLEGREMPVPARPEKLLEAMYGPSWSVPDPAFQFSTPERTVRALDEWFRGTRPMVKHWQRRAAAGDRELPNGFSGLARVVGERAQETGAQVLDVGAGRGRDSLWLARQGLQVTAYDFVPRALRAVCAQAEAEGLDLDVRLLNLTEWRSVFAEGARLAHDPRPRVMMARHVLEATSIVGRESLVRFASMALRGGGRLYADFHLGAQVRELPWAVGAVDPERVAALARRAGARVVEVDEVPVKKGPPVTRLMGEW
ncbi:methyltransferase domain-containing protein [Nocardioides sp. MAHUQ-72]|uniref:class I SAM-dependent methyltransferase n=1 Tax=unclassified Nocardioides TaxID=2615069 RepID=UPI003619856A